MKDKLGSYVQKLMVTIVDPTQENFVKELALQELNTICNSLIEFLDTHGITADRKPESSEKILLMDQKQPKEVNNGTN